MYERKREQSNNALKPLRAKSVFHSKKFLKLLAVYVAAVILFLWRRGKCKLWKRGRIKLFVNTFFTDQGFFDSPVCHVRQRTMPLTNCICYKLRRWETKWIKWTDEATVSQLALNIKYGDVELALSWFTSCHFGTFTLKAISRELHVLKLGDCFKTFIKLCLVLINTYPAYHSPTEPDD